MFRETPSRRQMALIAIRSARYNRRISAQSSTLSTSRCFRKGSKFSRNHGVSFQAEPTAEAVDDSDTIGRHCTRTYVLAYEGQCHLILGQAKQSIGVLETVLGAWPSAYRQDEGLARTWLATGYAHLGRIEEAAEQGEKALTIAFDAGSLRLIKALGRVNHELGSRRVTDEAQRFRDRLAIADQVVGRMGQ
ncbi:hypothetical protein [Micromonospora sp. WMMA1976]|uniref:hypothetical protein n=1 Tax=Micromonospora sp. WMMA1976 TaxID=3014995 RepID=UPI00248B5C29|nr:hypothetical protein [Micromonospora sp. WMMA1976]WBC06587.1 hypothetical protein O7546_10320 [Micromonospora sp. WMMA1976]